LIVVSIHWGPENKKVPTAKQQKLARRLIRAGANVIMGHHTHVVHPVEIYRGGVIFYSLGNLLFDQRGYHQRRATVAHVEWKQDPDTLGWGLSTVELHPVLRPKDMGNLKMVEGKVARSTLSRVRRRSRSSYGTKFDWLDDILVWRAEASLPE
jgi:poly-gamma-glutamate synthesis protein (capsule biosynthesis protein)